MKSILLLLAFAAPLGAADLQVEWNDNSTNETGFAIERAPGTTTTFAEIARVAADVVTYRDTGLADGAAFSYRVRAFNTGGNSAYSNTASGTTTVAPPGAPSNVTVTAVIVPGTALQPAKAPSPPPPTK